jgi:hypothetical protein
MRATGKRGTSRGIALLAVLEQHLHADADAEEGLAARGLDDRVARPACGKLAHAVRHRALSRHDHALGRADNGRIRRDRDARLRRHALERLRHGADIAHAVVDDDDLHDGPGCSF